MRKTVVAQSGGEVVSGEIAAVWPALKIPRFSALSGQRFSGIALHHREAA